MKHSNNHQQKPTVPGHESEFHYIKDIGAVVISSESSREFLQAPDAEPKDIKVKEKSFMYIPWGVNDDTPNQVISKVYKHPTTSGGTEFNIALTYGDGIIPVKREVVDGKLKFTPYFDNTEINTFLEDNDIPGYLLEQSTDLRIFFNVFPELILNRDLDPSKRKVVEINHKEACFSRWSEMNDKGIIENHLYCTAFGTNKDKTDKNTAVTPVLNAHRPLLDLKRRLGLAPQLDGKTTKDNSAYRFIVPINFPTPGRSYYQKPYWYSIFESGWFDYACMIPEYKKAILKNQMVIKYIVYVSPDYWTSKYAAAGVGNDEKKKKAIRDEEYKNIQDFLSGQENAGKAVVSEMKYAVDGKENPQIKIVPIENPFKGGEFIQDSEEASNLIAFGMGVHQGIIGSSPEKNKTISGTEARELFTIKQALVKPYRDRLLLPLYIAKAINNWPADIFFAIPNTTLTTLDKNTGAEKTTSQPAL